MDGPSQPSQTSQDDKISTDNGSCQSISSKIKQLSPQKQFAFITLSALGAAMLITGRTVREIMKRIPKTNPAENPTSQIAARNTGKQVSSHPLSDLESKTPHVAMSTFSNNKLLLNSRDPRQNLISENSNDQLRFNPAIDAIAAFGLATILVVGTSALTIKSLSNRWELDSWNDWRMFIQSGHLGKVLIPKNWNQTVSQSIPARLRPSIQELTQEEHEELESERWDWKRSVDQEWESEQRLREIERLQWEDQRKTLGKKIW